MSASPIRIFNAASEPTSDKEITVPISFRVTLLEKSKIKKLAGSQSVSNYLRREALGGKVASKRKKRLPDLDDKRLARLLGALGQSRLSSNMNQIAKAANMGALPVTDDLVVELHTACADIRAMRHDIITALGIKAEE
ncbi:MAG: hypothetical protein COA69_08685 [Robiginitomaculum sp.]|nr:MAG: hypothetical protein COA69_08685 [Robiginitomaculum sp.]